MPPCPGGTQFKVGMCAPAQVAGAVPRDIMINLDAKTMTCGGTRA